MPDDAASPATQPHAQPVPVLTLSRDEMRARALAFAKRWHGPQREESDAKTFLDEFFAVFGRDRHAIDARHEYHVERPDRGDGRIDLLWPGKLLVEMKSTGRDLSPEKGGAARQAFDYLPHLDPETAPRWVLVSDFARFGLYDLGEGSAGVPPADEGRPDPRPAHDRPAHNRRPHSVRGAGRTTSSGGTPALPINPTPIAAFTLADLPRNLRHFAFIRDEEQSLFQTQPEVNQKAVALLGELHDALKTTGYTGHPLERLLVRVLFCLFAEDTDIFPWNAFTRLVENSAKNGSDLGQRLTHLFQILDTPAPSRTPHLTADLRPFPYVNGGLFAERIDIPDTNPAHRAALLQCCRFDWSRISPGIFGSLFQGVMEPRERREKGAHYTSEENILRVIAPLFLDALRAEFAKENRPAAAREKRLQQFHDKLARLRFLDPACGCGNFLVVAYRELRTLELDLLRALHGEQLALGLEINDIARVNVDQFYGIELEEFPALIAETALWLTDHQVNMTFSKAFGKLYTRIPLKKSPTIANQNALRLDWNTVLPAKDCAYIMGNPPFIGHQWRTAAQQEDMALIWGDEGRFGRLDYVTAWYRKAADYIKGTHIGCAFVSTNSITQGEQVGILWAELFARGVKINFGHRTFVWHNEASGKAHVHCVVIGFGLDDAPVKRLFETDDDGKITESSGTQNISPYLIVGPNLALPSRTDPREGFPQMKKGSQPTDGGHLILTAAERDTLLTAEPEAEKWIRPYLGGEELINSNGRFCLWLKDAKPEELRHCPQVLSRVAQVRESRLKSPTPSVRDFADRPHLFTQDRQPDAPYLAVPEVSSETRRYIPIGFLPSTIIASNKLQIIVGGTLYHFGVLNSAMHIAWVRTVSGRLKSDISYSPNVYNTFPWPESDAKHRASIETAAQAILDARAPHLARGASLADLYDPLTMPAELLKAHRHLDHAVDRAYRPAPFATDRDRVEYLFARYEHLTAPLAPAAKKSRRRRSA